MKRKWKKKAALAALALVLILAGMLPADMVYALREGTAEVRSASREGTAAVFSASSLAAPSAVRHKMKVVLDRKSGASLRITQEDLSLACLDSNPALFERIRYFFTGDSNSKILVRTDPGKRVLMEVDRLEGIRRMEIVRGAKTLSVDLSAARDTVTLRIPGDADEVRVFSDEDTDETEVRPREGGEGEAEDQREGEAEDQPKSPADYGSYDEFASAAAGTALYRTPYTVSFYNTFAEGCGDEETIASLIPTQQITEENCTEVFGLNPALAVEESPLYLAEDGSYYAVSLVPAAREKEMLDFQAANLFYTDLGEKYTDIEYLGGGVFRIPAERVEGCFKERLTGAEDGETFVLGLRIQTLYTCSREEEGDIRTIPAVISYPDGIVLERLATADLDTGAAEVRIFAEDSDFMLTPEDYEIRISVNGGENGPAGAEYRDGCLLFAVGDPHSVCSLSIVITAKPQMFNVPQRFLAAKARNVLDFGSVYDNKAILVDGSKMSDNLAIGDKFYWKDASAAIRLAGWEDATDAAGGFHRGIGGLATRAAQGFSFYNGGNENAAVSWFINSLNTTAAAESVPSWVPMSDEYVQARINMNYPSTSIGNQRRFGYITVNPLTTPDIAPAGKSIDLAGTYLAFACMHAWSALGVSSPDYQAVLSSIRTFTGDERIAPDVGFSTHTGLTIAMMITNIVEEDDMTILTLKAATSVLQVSGVVEGNYQCGFSTLKLAYEREKDGFVTVKKESSDPMISSGNSCYDLSGIRFQLFLDKNCENPASGSNGKPVIFVTDSSGNSDAVQVPAGTYYVKELEDSIAGKGWKVNTKAVKVTVSAENTAENPAAAAFQNESLNDPSGIMIRKLDADGNVPKDFDLSGAEYTVSFYAGLYEAGNLPKKADASWVIRTTKTNAGNYTAALDDAHRVSGDYDKYGKTSAGRYHLPLGTLTIKETKAPYGFTMAGSKLYLASGSPEEGAEMLVVQIRERGSAVFAFSGNYVSDASEGFEIRQQEQYLKGGLSVTKTDIVMESVPQGDASFTGIRFAVEDSGGTIVSVITSNSSGIASTGKSALRFGDYKVYELRSDDRVVNGKLVSGTSPYANASYLWKKTVKTVSVTKENTIVQSDDPAPQFPDEPVRIKPPILWKCDAATGEPGAYGSASLAGIRFRLRNRSRHTVVIEGEKYAPGASIAVLVSEEDGRIPIPFDLPYGTYGVTEISANESYLLTDTEEKTFSAEINTEGNPVFVPATLSFYDDIYRGSFSVEKVNALTGERLAGIPFRLTAKNTGETHNFVTDSKGQYNSESIPNHANTNLMDNMLSGCRPQDIIPQEVMDSLPAACGLWFGRGDPDPDLDALPYGDYLLEEMKTERTRSMKMLKKEFSVSKKAAQIDLGTLENEEIRIATIARDERTGSHTASAEENTVLTDEVRMEGLEKGRKYSLSGIVLLKGEDGMSELLDAEGNPVHADLTFTASEKNMTEEVRFLIDARELAGKKLVIYEELRTADDDAFAAAHKDPLDEQQMISFPVIGTKAQTEEGNSYIQEGSESVLIDTVSYSGLIPQESYDLTASLVYKADGEPVLVDGEPVTAHKTFVPENASGSVEIRFTVDTAFLRPEPVVVFESLEVGGVELCIHADLEDEAQTLMYARIETQASCIMTQTQNAPADAACQLTDTVSYEGLKPGRQYDLICMLLDTESGEFLLLNGAETERRQRFTAADAEEGAYSACGSVDVEFTADTAALAGRTLAVYEKLYDGEILVASHCDEDAAEQQILIPAIATKALGKESGEQQICAEENQAITDTVSCENLIPGSEYLLKGRIVLREESGTHEEGQEGGTSRWSEPFEDPVCAEKYFTAEESAQEVTMDFEIDASLLEDQTLVVFEGLYLNDVLIASHCDPDAQEQSITVVKKQEETTEASSEESSEETTEESSEEPSEEPTEKTTEESSEELTTEESTPEESTPEESTPESNSEESTVPSTSPSEKQSTPENTTAPTSKTTPESTEPAVIITDDPGKPAVYLAIGVTSLVVLSAAALLYVLISSRKKDGGKRERG